MCLYLLWYRSVKLPNAKCFYLLLQGPSWSWSCRSWIYDYLCNQYLSPLTFWARIRLRRVVLDTTLCDKVCQWLAKGRWISPGTPISSTNKTYHNDMAEILSRVALSTIQTKTKLVTTTRTNELYIFQHYRTVRCVRALKGSVVNFTAYQNFIELI